MPNTNPVSERDGAGPSGLAILITGSSGLMGLPIAIELAKSNKVFGASPGFSNPYEEETLRRAGVENVRFDGGDSDLSQLPRQVDVVYHFGAIVGKHAEVRESREIVYNTNSYSVARLMSRYRDCKAFIYASSGSAYAYQGERPLREDDIFGFHTTTEVYAATKVGGEFIAQSLSREWGTPCSILRIFSPYSPRGGAVTMRVDLVAAGRPIRTFPGVPNRFCPIYEDDFVRKAIAAIAIANAPPEVVNFCGSATTTIEEYCAIAGRLLGKEPKFVRDGKYYPIWPETTKCTQLLGKDRVSLEEGIRRVVEAGPGVRLPSWISNLNFSAE